MIAFVTTTDIPGLVDVRTEDGREFRDLTLGQLHFLAMGEGWTLRGAV